MNANKRAVQSLALPSGRTLTVADDGGDAVELRAPDGVIELVLRFTDDGLQLTASAARLTLQATESIHLAAPEIKVDATSALHLSGAATTSLTSAGELRLEGALVRIN